MQIEDNGGEYPGSLYDTFEPYFSTRVGNGYGFGFVHVKMIVEEHCRGDLRVIIRIRSVFYCQVTCLWRYGSMVHPQELKEAAQDVSVLT